MRHPPQVLLPVLCLKLDSNNPCLLVIVLMRDALGCAFSDPCTRPCSRPSAQPGTRLVWRDDRVRMCMVRCWKRTFTGVKKHCRALTPALDMAKQHVSILEAVFLAVHVGQLIECWFAQKVSNSSGNNRAIVSFTELVFSGRLLVYNTSLWLLKFSNII